MNKWGHMLLSLLLLAGVTGAEDWHLQISISNSDSSRMDVYNRLGIRETAYDGYDRRNDVVKRFPPDMEYIAFYFPHNDSTTPYYWPPPHSGLYCYDYRAPGFKRKTWFGELLNYLWSNDDMVIWWTGLETIPVGYYIFLKVLSTADSINIRLEQSTSIFIPLRAARMVSITVCSTAVESLYITPGYTTVAPGERIAYTTFIKYEGMAPFEVRPEYSTPSELGFFEDANTFLPMDSGVGLVIADYYGATDTAEIKIEGTGSSYWLRLQAGWNLISFPRNTNGALSTILPGLSGDVWTYNALTGSYSARDTVVSGAGYFTLALKDTQLLLIGTPVTALSLPLQRGWNLIGTVSDTIAVDSLCTNPPGCLRSDFWWYDPPARRYFRTDFLVPGKGYFILVDRECGLNITSEK